MVYERLVCPAETYRVIHDGETIGLIMRLTDQWQYLPKGHDIGSLFYPSLEACKRALEGQSNVVEISSHVLFTRTRAREQR
jgi:hypothetical protein